MSLKKVDSKKLRDATYELGLSTYQLGAAAGVPQPTVSAILLGRRQPSSPNLKAICDALDLDLNEIFTEAETAVA